MKQSLMPKSRAQVRSFRRMNFIIILILIAISLTVMNTSKLILGTKETINMTVPESDFAAMVQTVGNLETDKKELMNNLKVREEEQKASANQEKGLQVTTHSEHDTKSMATTTVKAPPQEKCPKKKCALLFFGLIQNAFEGFILPSIQRNILSINPDCDVYLHTYNITSVPFNPRNQETKKSTLHAEDAYLLADEDHVMMETVKDFWAKREEVVNTTKKSQCPGWDISHINMMKQWHSINSVWDLMVQHEKLTLREDNNNEVNPYYEQIGLFRSDVYYVSPVSVYEHEAGVPDFGHWGGINDRMFYGKREYARLWSHRFDFVEDYMKRKHCFHSERYLNALLTTSKVPVKKNENVCIWRVRSGYRVSWKDCQMIPNEQNNTFQETEYLPLGYTLPKVKDGEIVQVLRDEGAEKRLETGDLEWPSEPLIDKRREVLLEAQSDNSCP